MRISEIFKIMTALFVAVSIGGCKQTGQPAESLPEETAVAETAEPATEETIAPQETELPLQTCNYQTEEISAVREGFNIHGTLYVPGKEGPLPLVILCHGFYGNQYNVTDYAQYLSEHGYLTCTFDFVGGGPSIESDGQMTDMSVLTEARDLEVILARLQEDSRVDRDHIFLFGESQGGYVCTYAAGTHAEEIRGLVLLYPAYVMKQYAWQSVENMEEYPDTVEVLGATVSGMYIQDVLATDIYEVMKGYDKEVLILHGTNDSLVPISYSEEAAETFANATLERIEGAAHGFTGDDKQTAAEMILNFLNGLCQPE